MTPPTSGDTDHQIPQAEVLQVVNHHRKGVEVVDWDVEESLQLLSVQVHCEDALNSGGGQKIGDQLCGNRHSRLILAVLAGIAKRTE